MKKRLLVFVLAMTLVFAYAVPVAATEAGTVVPEVPAVENIVDSVDPEAVTEEAAPNTADASEFTGAVSEDYAVQAAYDAYMNMMEAYSINEYGPMADACEELDKITRDFTDEQAEEWSRVVEEYIGLEKFVDDALNVGFAIYAVECKQAYKANPTAKTATEFVEAYDLCVEAEITIDLMDPDIAAYYEAAKADLPSENVMKVYSAYDELAFELRLAWWSEDFITVCEDFEAVLDIFNELTEAELGELAELMGVEDGEAAWNKVFTDWVNANMVLQIGEAYDAFMDNQNADTAKAYVDAYDSVANDTAILTQEDKDVILAFFADGSYDQAKEYLVDEPATGTDEPAAGTDEPVTEEEKSDGTVQTGDESNMLVPFAVMIAAAGVGVLALKRKRVQ